MNSQELSALQEAYSQVYQLDEMFRLGKKKGTSPRADAIINSPEFKKRMEDADKIAIQNLRDMMSGDKKRQNRVTMHPDNRTDLNDYKEQVDLYDIILSHLLDEGYAETQEQAEVIMVNMSEDWRESICEEYKKLPVGKMLKQAARHSKPEQVTKMGKVADDHNPAKAKRKEDDNRREGGRKRDAGRPRRNELQDNW